MKRFAQLFIELDQTTKTNAKLNALVRYFEEATDEDKVWAIALFTHRRPKRNVVSTRLKEWTAELAELPQWLFDESYHIVGDLAETLSLLTPKQKTTSDRSLSHWIHYLIALRDLDDEQKKVKVLEAWEQLGQREQFLFNKLMTGGFRVGVSQKMMTNALAKHTGMDPAVIAHKLMGKWDPATISFEELILTESANDDLSKPYPFYLAYALESEPEEIGEPQDWQAEWKWDGIRGQLIMRQGELFVWSRGEELVTGKFPEFELLRAQLKEDVVIDGEIMCWDDKPLPFNILQTRIGRKNVSRKILEQAPVILMAYDVLEYQGQDIRSKTQTERRAILEEVVQSADSNVLHISPVVDFETWDELKALREKSREMYAEGFMLKSVAADYKVGRKRGDWWKWKVDPLSIDAVMIYAQRGHGRRANLYTDFTFAVWNGDDLVTFTKAYSGLTDEEFKKVNEFIKKNTLDKFGPVRTVKAELVFEIGFEGIAASKRHKSGVALRFPRILRWRKDKSPKEANTLEDLIKLLEQYG